MDNYNRQGAYHGWFVDRCVNVYAGKDYCYSPTSAVEATSVTGTYGLCLGKGMDYYFTVEDVIDLLCGDPSGFEDFLFEIIRVEPDKTV